MWTVKKIHDGDTVDFVDGHGRVMRVRLWGMDAPEHGQIGFRGSRSMLTLLLERKPLYIAAQGTDRYGRTVAKIRNGQGEDVSLAMVRSGWAWWYRQYEPRELRLAAAEADARARGRGIWQEREPVSPWAYRHREERQRQKTAREGNARGGQ